LLEVIEGDIEQVSGDGAYDKLWSIEIGKKVSRHTISRGLKKLGYTRKKKTIAYLERVEENRVEFKNKLATYNREQLIYVDESGIDSHETYPYGWCPFMKTISFISSGKAWREGKYNWSFMWSKIFRTDGLSRIL